MGKYLNIDSKGRKLPVFDKALALIKDGAQVIQKSELKEGDVVVVENTFFDGALYVDEFEEQAFKSGLRDDGRPVIYLRYAPAKDIAYSKENKRW